MSLLTPPSCATVSTATLSYIGLNVQAGLERQWQHACKYINASFKLCVSSIQTLESKAHKPTGLAGRKLIIIILIILARIQLKHFNKTNLS
ncbi:hypothetical protein MTP99_002846 [Tenebrio molitor]|nr:hypothetical protein MTP99_002846 [Tenebrio molitor]